MAGSALHQAPGSTIILSKAAVPLPPMDSSRALRGFSEGCTASLRYLQFLGHWGTKESSSCTRQVLIYRGKLKCS